MAEDSRESGRPESGVATIGSGTGQNEIAVSLREEETLSLSEVKVEYDQGATANAVLEVYDEPEGIQQGNESDLVDRFYLTPGDRVNPDMVYQDIENDVLVTTGGSQDGEITVTAGGFIVTG